MTWLMHSRASLARVGLTCTAVARQFVTRGCLRQAVIGLLRSRKADRERTSVGSYHVGRSELLAIRSADPRRTSEPSVGATESVQVWSTTRSYKMAATMSMLSSVTLGAVVITYPQKLLSLARKLIDDNGEFGIAIVVAHMACEIATERTMSEAFAAKGVSYLEIS